jgi:hypothetical protein
MDDAVFASIDPVTDEMLQAAAAAATSQPAAATSQPN